LLERRTTRHQVLFELVARKLHVEIARRRLHDFVQPEIDRLECGQVAGGLDLLFEPLEFFGIIYVFNAHVANRTPFRGSAPILT
jgi:hypothetical protein